ncbi:MAG: TRAP transporter large permease subunit [Gammaproteobacteria bacterium]|nr:TRAP transporter large permease subunit [Gammaproteobacteria bacterium]
MEAWAIVMLVVAVAVLLLGYPVAFSLGAVSLLFGGIFLGLEFFSLLPLRIWGIMTNFTLLAVPLFVFMGIILEKSGLADDLLNTMGELCGKLKGGLGLSVVLVGALLAATTGVVGATVVTMSVIALPVMLKSGYKPELATGTIAAAGTLGQIIPPSIVLVLLGDVIGVPVGRLFMGAVTPGLFLIFLFIAYILIVARLNPTYAPAYSRQSSLASIDEKLNVDDDEPAADLYIRVMKSLVPPLFLIISVLGSIFLGIASPTESAAVGALGALLLAVIHKKLNLNNLQQAMRSTTRMTSMVFLILIGATAFGLVFRGMGGDELVKAVMTNLPGGEWGFLFVSMAIIFLLGFFLDFIEICFIVVPILAPIAHLMGIDLMWFAVLIAVNLQTSFLTPPFGFSLFYLKAAAPPSVKIQQIYRGIIPFVILQVITLMLIIVFPKLVTWLPDLMDNLRTG